MIDSVFLNWEDSGAKEYLLQIANAASDNDQGWTTVAHITDGAGWQKRPIKITLTQTRFVRVRCLQRLSGFGYSMYDMEVYGPSSTPAVMKEKREPFSHTPLIQTSTSIAHIIFTIDGVVTKDHAIHIFSAKGKLVRSLPVFANSLIWDCKDMTGAIVAEGIYFAQISTQINTINKKITICR